MKRNIGILGHETKTPPEVIREGLNDTVDVANDQVLLPWFGIGSLKDDWEIVYDWVLTHEVECVVYAAKDDVHHLIKDAPNVRILEGDPVVAVASNATLLLYLWGAGNDVPEMLDKAVHVPTPPDSVLDLTNGLVPVIISDSESSTTDDLSEDELDIMPATFVKAYAQERLGRSFTTKSEAMEAMFPVDISVGNSAPQPPVLSSEDTSPLYAERIRNAANELVSAIAEAISKETSLDREG
jgi:hypothetical protein